MAQLFVTAWLTLAQAPPPGESEESYLLKIILGGIGFLFVMKLMQSKKKREQAADENLDTLLYETKRLIESEGGQVGVVCEKVSLMHKSVWTPEHGRACSIQVNYPDQSGVWYLFIDADRIVAWVWCDDAKLNQLPVQREGVEIVEVDNKLKTWRDKKRSA